MEVERARAVFAAGDHHPSAKYWTMRADMNKPTADHLSPYTVKIDGGEG